MKYYFGYTYSEDCLLGAEQVSTVMWLVHADLHESRVIASIEYLSTTVIYVEPQLQLPSESKILNLRRGRIRVRTKKRNGRVREQVRGQNHFISMYRY